jgi:dipeptidyl aminopeptidase/acylaminoacyl peptidase
MKSRAAFRITAVLLILVVGVNASQSAAQQRPLTTDDLYRLVAIGECAFSPDGRWLAYVMKRPKGAAANFSQDFYMDGNNRGDIWLVSTHGGAPRNLTKGDEDGAGSWSPVWSPDSQRLAMLSTKGGRERLWVWDVKSDRARPVTDRAVAMYGLSAASFFWASDHSLIAGLLPEGENPLSMTVESMAGVEAMKQWPKAWAGKEPTASALTSGVPATLDQRPESELVLIDLAHPATVIAKVRGSRQFNLCISPDRSAVAFVRQTGVRPQVPDRPAGPAMTYNLVVARTEGTLLTGGLSGIDDMIPQSLRWSPAGELAFIGHTPDSRRESQQVFTWVPGDTLPRAFPIGGLDPAPQEYPHYDGAVGLVWAGKNSLLVLARRQGPAATSSSLSAPSGRRDWWLVQPGQEPRNLTAGMKTPPAELFAEQSGSSFIGLDDGVLWRISTDGRPIESLSPESAPRIAAIVWPGQPERPARPIDRLIVQTRKPEKDLYVVELPSAKFSRIDKPTPEASIAALDSTSAKAALAAHDRTGTYLWVSNLTSHESIKVVETNTFLREIAAPTFKKIEYRHEDGTSLGAWLLLPASYREGDRLPLVTWVYPQRTVGDQPWALFQLDVAHSLNLALLTAHGYAVLLPSTPMKPDADVYTEIPKGVLPAVEKVVDLGIADPDRLAVMGQSYGGYSVYALVTQTNRFKAAVSLAGISDLVADYGIFDARFRYDPFPQEQFFATHGWETGWGGLAGSMGAPPFGNYDRYIRNSPLTYVERVQTPLMIIQGDQDIVPIQEGEMFFNSLYRQNKRAEFVRYWGEGHVLQSPANVRDMWRRIYAWLDELIGPVKTP